MTRISAMTIGDALNEGRSIWFQPGSECQRLDSVTWLEAPTANIPQMILDIAKNLGIHAQLATELARIIKDADSADGNRLDRSKSFKALPIAGLEIWEKSTAFFQKMLHNHDSSGAAHAKLMNGQWLKNGERKNGLIDIFHGDLFAAHVAHYLAFGGMGAVRDVQGCMGWNASKIRDMALIVVNASNRLVKKIGKNGLKWLAKAGSAGLGFLTMLFRILNGKPKAISAMEMGIVSAKKTTNATKATPLKIATAKTQDIQDNNGNDGDDGDDAEAIDADEDTDDPICDVEVTDDPICDVEVTDHVAADGPDPDQELEFDSDSLDAPPEEDQDDQHAALQMGRELAYTMLIQARKKSKSQSQRHRLLLDTIDEKILLNALQKGLRPTDLAVAERMADFLSFCWQWAERKGVFLEKAHQKSQILDLPEGAVIKRIIHAVQNGYWETGDNKPADAGKIWVDVMHHDRLAVLTRPVSPQLQIRNLADGRTRDARKVIVNPDPALREHFFQHASRKNWPRECNLRYFVAVNGTHETITAQQFVHPRRGAMSNAVYMDENDLDNINHEREDAAPVFDFPNDDDAAVIQQVAETTGVNPGIIRRVLLGEDDRAQEILARTCRLLPEDRKAAIEQMFSSGMTEIGAENAIIVSPSCLNQKTRLDLARLMNLDMGTLEKAFADDSDSVRKMKRAIKSMPEHDRSEAIRMIHLAAR